jgi:hypothetical protein
MSNLKTSSSLRLVFSFLIIAAALMLVSAKALAVTQQSGSTGVQGTVPGPPPSQAAVIDIPKNGQSFSSSPITVAGSCPANTLVEIYKNNVFAGSVNCANRSFSLQIDLFNGRNDLVARVFDALNQSGPDSATVTVNFNSAISTNAPQLLLTTNFAKRGADPGSVLSWPISLSGGSGPYALSIDWGDKSNPDLISQRIPGDITLQHTYSQSGVYKVTVKATDSNGLAAFLQLTAIANGPITQTGATNGSSSPTIQTKVLLWPVIVLFILVVIAFWVGKRHQLEAIQNRLRKGEPPF